MTIMNSSCVAAPQMPPVVSGGGSAPAPADVVQVLPVLEQLATVLRQLAATIASSAATGQAVAGADAVGVQGGGGSGSCCCAMATAGAARVGASAGADGAPRARPVDAAPEAAPRAAPEARATTAAKHVLDSPDLTVKGARMSSDQRRNLQAVLEVGVKMGASRKVLQAAVSTVIQESVARNDSSVDGRDRDSLGLFQQRPSQGWGTRAQISDPRYAARKFYEQAIPKDRAHPQLSNTRLAQAVQRSAHPDAYARWDAEARAIVADFTS